MRRESRSDLRGEAVSGGLISEDWRVGVRLDEHEERKPLTAYWDRRYRHRRIDARV